MDVIVENIALLRDEAGFADLVAEVAFVGFVVGSGGGDLLNCRCMKPESEHFDYLHNGGELRITVG